MKTNRIQILFLVLFGVIAMLMPELAMASDDFGMGGVSLDRKSVV